MEILLFYLGGAILVAVVANSKGRSGFGWFLLSLFITPLLTLLAVGVMPRVQPPAPVQQQEAMKVCPRCAEHVKWAAVVCRYCGNEFGREAPQPVGASAPARGAATHLFSMVVVTVSVLVLLMWAFGGQ